MRKFLTYFICDLFKHERCFHIFLRYENTLRINFLVQDIQLAFFTRTFDYTVDISTYRWNKLQN